MKKLAIGLVAFFVVACGSEGADIYHLDSQLTDDGLYGTFERGEVRLEFASFEIDDGVFAVTIIGDDLTIDAYLLPDDSPLAVASDRPTDVVDFGNRADGPRGFGTFLLPDDSPLAVASDRPTDVVDFGNRADGPRGFGTFLLPDDNPLTIVSDRPTDVVDWGPGTSTSGRDLDALGAGLNERYPDQPAAVRALLGAVGHFPAIELHPAPVQ